MTKYFLTIALAAGAAILASTSFAAGPTTSITIQEFADFECHYCAIGSSTMRDILKDYPGKVRLVFRNMPLPFHANAVVAAKAYSAVWLQNPDLAYAFQEEIFDHQDQFRKEGEPYLYTVANKLGVVLTQMKTDMAGNAVARMLADDDELAKAYNFKGTPSFMIGTEPVTGAIPYDEFKKIINRQLGL